MNLVLALTVLVAGLAIFRLPIVRALERRLPMPPSLLAFARRFDVAPRRVVHVTSGLLVALVTLAGLVVIGIIDHRLGIGGGVSLAALYTVDTLPKTSQEAIREFNERYLMGTSQALPPTWANQLGDVIDVASPLLTFPTSVLALNFQESKGENRFKTLGEDSFDLKVREFDEGAEAKVIDLKTNTFAYRKWLSVADRLRLAEQRHVATRIALDVIEGNMKCGWDGLALFHDSHIVNPRDDEFGTFDNLQGSAKDVVSVDNIAAEFSAMIAGVKDENGEKLIQEPQWAIIVPSEKLESLNNLLAQDFIVQTILNVAADQNVAAAPHNNPYKGRIEVVHAPQLTDVNDWYIVEKTLLAAMMPPWISARYDAGPELSMRVFDEATDFFKNTGKIAMSNHLWYGFGAVYPHAIRKVVGA